MIRRRAFYVLIKSWSLAVLLALALENHSFSAPSVTFEGDLKPFITKYCLSCHNNEKAKADLNLEALTGNDRMIERRTDWEKVREMLTEREMPPEKEPQPAEEGRDQMVRFIADELAKFDCSGPVNPGRVTLRRLNRKEYNNTVRDLVGIDFNPAADFPSDEVGYGFDNIGDVLSLPPLLMEKYLTAAEEIANKAIVPDYPPSPPRHRVDGDRLKPSNRDVRPDSGSSLGLYREGEGEARHEIREKGKYTVRARAYGQQAGLEPPKMGILVDGKEARVFDVTTLRDKPRVYQINVDLDPGQHRFSFAYLNNYVNSDHPDPNLRGDRNLFINWIEVEGPTDKPLPPLPESHTRILKCDPLHRHGRSCARESLAQFARRAYRRPVSNEEVDRLTRFIGIARSEGGTFLEGMQLAVQAVLCSPHFLFRWELDPQPEHEAQVRALNDHELASRLSYFLWSSMPDQELSDLADQGKLSHEDVLMAQVKRMLAAPQSTALVANFGLQWLQIQNLDTSTPDPQLFPEFTDAMREAMKRETQLFFEAVMREDRSLFDLIDANFTYLNGPLARHYGIEGVQGNEFRKVSLDPGSQRGGILGHASILTITSNPTRTSPVNRGKWVLEQVLGTPPPPPPPNVPELEESKEAAASASLRERLELHRAKAECATCHSKMDPIGFAFENFNPIGAWRDRDGEFTIDASGTLPSGESFKGPNDLKRILRTRDTFVRSVSEKMLTYAVGRGLEYYDKCTVDDLYTALSQNNYRFSTLVSAIVQSDTFRKKNVGVGPRNADQQAR